MWQLLAHYRLGESPFEKTKMTMAHPVEKTSVGTKLLLGVFAVGGIGLGHNPLGGALIVSRPGFSPDSDFVAEKLKTSTRTLRRKLKEENASYQQILYEVRYQLAKGYLSNSTLRLEEVSVLLDYSTPGNFSAAFKRWHGSSPRQFRQHSPQA